MNLGLAVAGEMENYIECIDVDYSPGTQQGQHPLLLDEFGVLLFSMAISGT